MDESKSDTDSGTREPEKGGAETSPPETGEFETGEFETGELAAGELEAGEELSARERLIQEFDAEAETESPAPAGDEATDAETDGAVTSPPAEPFYRNRAVIAATTAVATVLVSRAIFSEPARKPETQAPPSVTATYAPDADPEPKLAGSPFRELKSMEEFDPWAPLNGGIPVPPESTQERLAAVNPRINSGGRPNMNTPIVPMPDRMAGEIRRTGPIVPFDPRALGPLPNVNGAGSNGSGSPVNPGGSLTPLPPAGESRSNSAKPNESKRESKSPSQSEKEPAGSPHYLAVSVTSADGEGMQSRAAAIASQCGGDARKFVLVNEEGQPEQFGVLIVVPPEKYEKAKDLASGLAGASIESESAGRPSARQGSISGILVARLKQLQEKREELLKDFLADAPAVKQIDEAIQKQAKAVAAARAPGGNVAVIRVMIR